jgi:FeS assembly SUF system protein
MSTETENSSSSIWNVNFKGDGMTPPLKDQIIVALKKVYDPEIPVDVYELGLIYDVDVSAEQNVNVVMTLTSPNCPSAEQIPGDVEKRLKGIETLKEIKVAVTFEPPWVKEKMSQGAMLELGMDM